MPASTLCNRHVCSVFEELFAAGSGSSSGGGGGELLQPDEVVFAVMLRGWGRVQPPQWNAISGVLSTMERRHGISPTTATYNALLDCCARHNDADRAAEIIQRMAASGVLPDDFTLEAIKGRRSMRSLLKRAFASSF